MPVQPVADKPRGVDAVDERRRVLRDPGGEHDDFVVRRPERKSKAVEVKGRGAGCKRGAARWQIGRIMRLVTTSGKPTKCRAGKTRLQALRGAAGDRRGFGKDAQGSEEACDARAAVRDPALVVLPVH
jgi:hypothetical protein